MEGRRKKGWKAEKKRGRIKYEEKVDKRKVWLKIEEGNNEKLKKTKNERGLSKYEKKIEKKNGKWGFKGNIKEEIKERKKNEGEVNMRRKWAEYLNLNERMMIECNEWKNKEKRKKKQ